MLNWIAWNKTVLTFKLRPYAKLNCVKRNLNAKLKLFEIELIWHLTVCKQKQYLYKTELFEIELFICIKKDLSLNNLQMFICHKIQINKNTKYKHTF